MNRMRLHISMGLWASLCMSVVQAQQWCPPGAELRYPYVMAMDPLYQPYGGVQQFRYVGDTLFQGEPCQHIQSDLYLRDTTGTLVHYGPGSAFTSVTPGGAVRLYNTDVPGSDTLAWFGAQPGASWTLHYPNNQNKLITVINTGARVVNGLLLRYLVIGSQPPAYSFVTDTIFERIGARALHNLSPFLGSYFMESSTPAGLGCYHDNEFNFSPFGMLCDSPVPVAESQAQTKAFTVWPNPGNDRIRLASTLDQPPLQAMIFNMQGILVLAGQMDPASGMDVNKLAPGTYVILLRDRKGKTCHVKWVKGEHR